MAGRAAIEEALSLARPLDAPRQGRLPLLVWRLTDADGVGPAELRTLLAKLDERGLALISSWNHTAAQGKPGSMASAIGQGRAQRDAGLDVCVNANALLHRFCDGSEPTAHVDESGAPFFDRSFDPGVAMGCPFALEGREGPIRGRVEAFADAYARAGIAPSLVFADWEIDGAMEWNGAWAASRRCSRCRAAIPEIDDFHSFQQAVRAVRSRLQRRAFAEPLRARFPAVLVGNYGVYAHGGLRSWYDWFEELPEGAPTAVEDRAPHRFWAHELEAAGYTLAMPVHYPWARSWAWSDLEPADARWAAVYLLEASIAGAHASPGVPILPFVHWKPIAERGTLPPGIVAPSRDAYREVLRHVLLRGAAGLFLWCADADAADELPPVHEVYRESLRDAGALASGRPVRFDLAPAERPVVSALRSGAEILERSTDFRLPGAPATTARRPCPPESQSV